MRLFGALVLAALGVFLAWGAASAPLARTALVELTRRLGRVPTPGQLIALRLVYAALALILFGAAARLALS
jgi:hypothetical protein